ncbi:protein root UVB sensitive 6-like isoform X3 [Mangifera indica]|uniref:protein root UVB sensitive 6-like isoform X3 n=1 Tax=Mangifera indica TaxID=29780 RepID=UPI001CFB32C4|nr:protein root UVB sensitive 6-like isoform X3 [Mangifera indica]
MRIIANLVTLSASISEAAVVVDDVGSSSFGLAERPQFVELSLRLICAEEIGCRRWNYLAEKDGARKFKRNSFVLFLCRVLKLLLRSLYE